MRLCLVAPANNYHTKKWANWFLKRGHIVNVISFVEGEIPGVKVHCIETGANPESKDISKIKYLIHAKRIRKIVDKVKPDITNAHYATSYGAAVALSGIKNYVLSVWGSDIYDFPRKSVFHKFLLKYSLWKAPHLFSTSKAMAKEASKYTNKEFEITPFGVDMELFNPNKRIRPKDDKREFVVGTVKGLSDKYGIADIIKAVAIIKAEGKIPITLRIAGKGPQERDYKQLCKNLGMEDITTWLGFISQEEAAKEWANMDVAIIASASESESFGVSAVEAQACGTPVIITDIPGLKEATEPGKTSIVIQRKKTLELAEKIHWLKNNKSIRKRMSEEGRNYVCANFEINECFKKIENLLESYR